MAAPHDETVDSVASALPDCETLCAICNQSAHLDIERTQQLSATWTIWPRERTTTIGDWNSDTLASLDASTVHRIWILPRRGALRQLRRIWTRQTTESIRNAGQISMANVSRSGLSRRKRRKKVVKPAWQMLAQSWATPAAATLLWRNTLVKRCDGSRRIACRTGNRDNGIARSNIPRVPCA